MEFRDKTLRCINCGKEFVFSARDQKHYKEMGFENEPRRCRECRALFKRERQIVKDSNGNTKEFFKTTCAACGKPAYVPFKPTGSKPVYCRDCLVAEKIKQEQGGAMPDVTPDAPSAPSTEAAG